MLEKKSESDKQERERVEDDEKYQWKKIYERETHIERTKKKRHSRRNKPLLIISNRQLNLSCAVTLFIFPLVIFVHYFFLFL